MSALAKLKTWTTSQEEEDRMFKGHFHHWKTMIENVVERDLQNKRILDFGCNQGGFLRMLYNTLPFDRALGVDIAEESYEKANRLNPALPVSYQHVSTLDNLENEFDIAFSHEVIYLLQDLDAHAKTIKKVLKEGGVYYAATGCHTENPAWPQWHKSISDYSNIPVPNYSLDDYAAAFAKNGFHVEALQFKSRGFIVTEPDDKVYYPRLIDKLNYYSQYKILFRFSK